MTPPRLDRRLRGVPARLTFDCRLTRSALCASGRCPASKLPSRMQSLVTVEQALSASGLIPLEGGILLGHVLAKDRAWIAAHRDAAVDAEELRTFQSLARRRRNGEAGAYLTG